MGEQSNDVYFYTNLSGGWNISTIAANNLYTVGTSVDNKVDKLEKQLKEFYEKNSSDKCISSVVEKQLVTSN